MESIIDAVNELLLQHTQLCGIIYKLRESCIHESKSTIDQLVEFRNGYYKTQ